MYMNQYQKQIARLIDEYGSLTKSQLLLLVNAELGTHIPNLDGYISQMCHFTDYEEIPYAESTILLRKGCEPDYDVIRSVSVMLCFVDKIVSHGRGRKPVSVRLFISREQHIQQISIIPVNQGEEQMLSTFAEDRIGNDKNSIVIFLIKDREQIKLMNTNSRFAVIEKQGVVFFKK